MIFQIKVYIHQLLRYLRWIIWYKDFAHEKIEDLEKFPVELFRGKSLLIRKLSGVDPELQKNKVESLKIAAEQINGTVIRPGKVFSFCFSVGRPTKSKGYKKGLEMRNGEMTSSTAGGICQLSNMIHWGALHSGLEILERHRHHFDLFPDDKRSIPFGTGATTFYNYIDLRIKNTLDQSIVLNFRFYEEDVELKMLSEKPLPYTLSLSEQDHKFYNKDGRRFRYNKIVQLYQYPDGSSKKVIALENDCEVKY